MNSLFILLSKHVFGGWTFWSLWKAFLVLSLLISLLLVVQLLIKFGPLQWKFRRELLQNSPPYFVSCLMLIKATGVIKLFCDYSNLTWHQLNNIPSCPLTSITKGPHWAIARKFPDSIQADMNFRHCLSQFCFDEQWLRVVREYWLTAPDSLMHMQKSVAALLSHFWMKERNLVCFYVNLRYLHLRTLLPLSWSFYWINAAGFTWT